MARSFDEVVDEILNKHSKLFEDLAKVDTLEYEAGQFIVMNKDEIKTLLRPLRKKQTDLYPDSLYSIYLQDYEEHAIKIIRDLVVSELKLDAENGLRIDRACIKLVAGDLLVPEREDNE